MVIFLFKVSSTNFHSIRNRPGTSNCHSPQLTSHIIFGETMKCQMIQGIGPFPFASWNGTIVDHYNYKEVFGSIVVSKPALTRLLPVYRNKREKNIKYNHGCKQYLWISTWYFDKHSITSSGNNNAEVSLTTNNCSSGWASYCFSSHR